MKKIISIILSISLILFIIPFGSYGLITEACDVSKIDYWDGTLATKFESGVGSEADPYIIATAEQLAFCCLGQNPNTSSNKYYKVSDNVKTFVMQPESIVDINELLVLENADAVNEYFAALEGKLNWIEKFNRQSFNGHFDGNGATVYGLYATSEGTQSVDVALFPQYDGGTKVGNRLFTNTCKNIQLKNSYLYSKRRLGGIVGAAYLTNYGANIDGKITIDTCAVVNCYMEAIGNWSFYQDQGVVAGGGLSDVIELKNIFVNGTYAYNTERQAMINLIGNGSSRKVADKYVNTLSDSIVLGTPPYGLDFYNDKVHQPYAYTNVVTDFPSGVVDLATPTWQSATIQFDYTDHIFSVTEKGAAFKAAANMLDWKNVWFMSENGPELQVFHTGVQLITDSKTHVWKCDCCGLESADGVTNHNFILVGSEIKGDGTDVYMCSECEYVCQHNEQTVPEYDVGDCVTASGVYARCKFCDWYIVTDVGGISGHKLTYVASDIGNCEVEGHKEYWLCSVCNNKFTSDNVYAPMNTAVSDEYLSTGFGPHFKEETEDGGFVILYDENGHWYKCAVNGGRLDKDNNDLGEDGYIKHNFKNTICIDCGYQCINHNLISTGEITSRGDCYNDELSEVRCTRCGYKSSVVTKKAGHTLYKYNIVNYCYAETTNSDDFCYKCEDCKKYFSDINATKEISKPHKIYYKHKFELQGEAPKGDGNDVYICTHCNASCSHFEQSVEAYDAGDCVNESVIYSKCKSCPWYIVTTVGGVSGHKFVHKEERQGNCQTNGRQEYWYCTVCKNKFTTNDIFAPMGCAVTDEQLITSLSDHVVDKSEIFYDNNGHWYKCKLCNTNVDDNLKEIVSTAQHNKFSYKDLGLEGHLLSCSTCGYSKNTVTAHNFKNNICDLCGFEVNGCVLNFETNVPQYNTTRFEINGPDNSNYKSAYVHGGLNSIHLLDTSHLSADLLLNADSPLEIGKPYDIVFWASTDTVDNLSTPVTLVHNSSTSAQNSIYAIEDITNIEKLTVGKWTKYTYTFVACTKWVSLRFGGSSSLYFDDIIINQLNTTPHFKVNNATAKKGDTFNVDVSVNNNPGIVSTKLKIVYDSNIVELVDATSGVFNNTYFGPLNANPFIIFWVNTLLPNNTTNGNIATLTFKIKDNISTFNTEIAIEYDPEDVYDANFNNVTFNKESGNIDITTYTIGDINGDNLVNNKDLALLMEQLNGWYVEINKEASDVNSDGFIDNKDYAILMRYTTGWKEELTSKKKDDE